MTDPILDELYAVREAYAARLHYDAAALIQEAREQTVQQTAHTVVAFPPKLTDRGGDDNPQPAVAA